MRLQRATEAVRSGAYSHCGDWRDGTIRHAGRRGGRNGITLGTYLGQPAKYRAEIGLCREPGPLAKALLSGPARSMLRR